MNGPSAILKKHLIRFARRFKRRSFRKIDKEARGIIYKKRVVNSTPKKKVTFASPMSIESPLLLNNAEFSRPQQSPAPPLPGMTVKIT